MSDNEFFSVEFDIPLGEMGDGYILAVLRRCDRINQSNLEISEANLIKL